MRAEQLWKRYCEYFQHYPQVGFSLDISRINFPGDFFQKMSGLVTHAFEEMHALEKGEIVNRDESRMVGHYWLRTPELAPDESIRTSIIKSQNEIADFTQAIHSGRIVPEKSAKFTNILLIGIGGSALGPQLVADALGTLKNKMSISYLDNTDPDGFNRVLSTIGDRLGETLTVVISKSGGTVETRNGQLEIAAAYKNKGLNFSKHAVAITCPDSKLDKKARQEKWLHSFEMWDWVGGRTSLFSAVGLLPASLQGFDIKAFLKGASQMDALTREKNTNHNPAMLLALMWHFVGDGRGSKDMVVLPYKDRLMLMSKYLQQLVMESLGKEFDRNGKVVNQGIAVYGNKGSTDQHAYVQQLRDGVLNFFATFIEVLEDYIDGSPKNILEVESRVTSGDYLSGFFLGTRKALYEKDRQSITITIDRLNAESLGALIALFERAVGFYASMVNINAYHQPGVEAGKKAATRVIELQGLVLDFLDSQSGSGKSLGVTDISSGLSALDEAETIYKILEHLSENSAHRVVRDGGRHPTEAKYRLK